MSQNKLISSIDLDLSNAELKTLISDIKLSLAFVVDVNHDGDGPDDLSPGEVRAKSLDLAGTSELSDSVYKPLNPNISQYPLAGEFIVTLDTSLGEFYLTTVNLFNSTISNIDENNISGYVSFTDDENTNQRQIKADKKTQKSVLENNKEPFDSLDYNIPFPFFSNFGDVNVFGRYGNRISLTKSDTNSPEMLLDNGVSSIELRNGSFSYVRKSSNVQIPFEVNNEISSEFTGEQVYIDSDRLFSSIGRDGIIQETSGIISLNADEDISFTSFKETSLDGARVNLGQGADNKVVLGDDYLDDFKELLDSMVRFAENLKAQDRILSLSNAANNFLTDLNNLGWNNFNKSQYLSGKVYTE